MLLNRFAISFLFIINIMVCELSFSAENTGDTSNPAADCSKKSVTFSGFNYEWRLATFSKDPQSTLSVNIVIERERRQPESHQLQAPFEIKLDDNFRHVVLSRSASRNIWHFALRQVQTEKCKPDRIVYEMSTVEPLAVFRHVDVSSVQVIPSPDIKNYYSGDLKNLWGNPDIRKARSGMSTYTYPYKYCADIPEKIRFPDVKNERALFKSVVKMFYCHMRDGKATRQQLLERVKFPLKYSVNHTEGVDTKKLSRDDFLAFRLCCGNVRPGVRVEGTKGYFHRDRYGSGEGEALSFELEQTSKKWYLTAISIDSY